MELVPGQTLRERLDDPTPIDPWQAAGLAAQVAEALEAAHRAGLVHRDIKPANVLLAGDGRVKVADFGIAKAVEEADLTQPGLMVGTAKYVAPEQVEGKPVDARTDIYSLGIVLYEMLCGRAPFEADTEAATALGPPPARSAATAAGAAGRAQVARGDRGARHGPLARAALRLGRRPPRRPARGRRRAQPGDRPHGHVRRSPPVRRRRPSRRPSPPAPRSHRRLRRRRRSDRPSAAGSCRRSCSSASPCRSGIAGLLLGRSGAGDLIGGVKDAITGSPGADAGRGSAGASAFDPDCDRSLCAEGQRGGDDSENQDTAGLAIDGDPATAWRTQGYDNRDITAAQAGRRPRAPARVGEGARASSRSTAPPTAGGPRSTSPTRDPGDLARLGQTRSRRRDGLAAGTSTIDLGDTRGRGRARSGSPTAATPRPRAGRDRRGASVRTLTGRISSLAASLPRPTTRRWSAPPSRATAPPSTRCSAGTTTASTPCAGGWPATRPTPSTPPRKP